MTCFCSSTNTKHAQPSSTLCFHLPLPYQCYVESAKILVAVPSPEWSPCACNHNNNHMVCWSLPLKEEHITTRNPPLPSVSFPLNTSFAREIHLKHGEIPIIFLTLRYDLATIAKCCSKPSMVDC